MMPLQNTCTKIMVAAVSKSAGATATGYVDTLGFREAAIDIELDSQASTTSNPSVLKLSESEDTVVSNATDITKFVGDATDGFTVGPADSVTPYITRLNVDLRGKHKRYLHITINPTGTTGLVSVRATLGKAGDSTVARAGMKQVVDA
jgi:hypothetical protein